MYSCMYTIIMLFAQLKFNVCYQIVEGHLYNRDVDQMQMQSVILVQRENSDIQSPFGWVLLEGNSDW